MNGRFDFMLRHVVSNETFAVKIDFHDAHLCYNKLESCNLGNVGTVSYGSFHRAFYPYFHALDLILKSISPTI